MVRYALFALAAACAVGITPAAADVTQSSPSVFLIEAEAEIAAAPDEVWRRLVQPDRWWSDAHTYSGQARHMRLSPQAGGCWCERWNGGEIEHGRVVLAMTHQGARTLRLTAALGPLQALGAQGVLTFTIEPTANGSKLAMSYRVAGDPSLSLEAMAAPVNGVMMEQFGRLVRYSDTGSPD